MAKSGGHQEVASFAEATLREKYSSQLAGTAFGHVTEHEHLRRRRHFLGRQHGTASEGFSRFGGVDVDVGCNLHAVMGQMLRPFARRSASAPDQDLPDRIDL